MYRQLSLFSTIPVSFQKVQKFLNSVPCINQGGCGVSALAMMLWMKKNAPALAKKTRIFFGYYCESDLNTNANVRKHKNGRPESPAHCWLNIDGKNEDSTGKIVSGLPYTHPVSITFLKDTIKRASWNSSFDRCEIPHIESTLGVKLGV